MTCGPGDLAGRCRACAQQRAGGQRNPEKPQELTATHRSPGGGCPARVLPSARVIPAPDLHYHAGSRSPRSFRHRSVSASIALSTWEKHNTVGADFLAHADTRRLIHVALTVEAAADRYPASTKLTGLPHRSNGLHHLTMRCARPAWRFRVSAHRAPLAGDPTSQRCPAELRTTVPSSNSSS